MCVMIFSLLSVVGWAQKVRERAEVRHRLMKLLQDYNVIEVMCKSFCANLCMVIFRFVIVLKSEKNVIYIYRFKYIGDK